MIKQLSEAIQGMVKTTDSWPWYWVSYGEKCYSFATVSAYPLNAKDPFPKAGTELLPDEDDPHIRIGENGVKMILVDTIANIEDQANGGVICRFIAVAHAFLLQDHLFDSKHNKINTFIENLTDAVGKNLVDALGDSKGQTIEELKAELESKGIDAKKAIERLKENAWKCYQEPREKFVK